MEVTRMRCLCGHDLSAHRQGFCAPCAAIVDEFNLTFCTCKDFVSDENGDDDYPDQLTEREEERKA